MAERTDAIVVGLGAAGGIIAEQLARDGAQSHRAGEGPSLPGGLFPFET